MDVEQEGVDRFYWDNGPCCAGCDHWNWISAYAGSCTKAAPISGEQRLGLLDMSGISAPVGAGHPLTLRHHHCGEFKDDFDWSTLPLDYQYRIAGRRLSGEA